MTRKSFDVLKDVIQAKPGTVVQLRVSFDGVPLEQFWRNRLNDGDIAPVKKQKIAPVKEEPETKTKAKI